MKNTHVLPTEKPSYLYQIGNDLTLSVVNSIHQHNIGRHIYITSDEEIKEGDWCLDEKENIVKADKDFIFNCSHEFDEYWKKIILTTDQDLIGVQAIDDEFLEWFVKNPSCDKVDVIKNRVFRLDEFHQREFYNNYKIIIPRATQQIIDEDYAGGLEMGQILSKVEHKQETLGEAAKKYFKNKGSNISFFDAVFFGAKWKQEQDKNKFSEEDLKDAYMEGGDCDTQYKTFQEWFEQFKKK